MASVSLSHSDSTLKPVLAALAREDSFKTTLPAATQSQGVRPVSPTEKSAISRLVRASVSWIIIHWLLMAVAIAACALAATILGIMTHRRAKKESRRFMTTMRLSLMDAEVQRACLHIEKCYGDLLLTPAAVCAAIVTGEPFLQALFERELGMTIAAYIDQVRIHHAKRIASNDPTTPSSLIAEQVGFSDEAAFAAQFEKLTGSAIETYCKEKRTYT
jgi:AraC-like DNA-binding protein